jgi:hypothetical protein
MRLAQVQIEMNAETTFKLRALPAAERQQQRLRFLLPIVAFAALVLTFAWALNHNPREIPSALIGRLAKSPWSMFLLPGAWRAGRSTRF